MPLSTCTQVTNLLTALMQWDDLKFGSEDVDDVEGKLSLRDADDDTDDEWNGSEDEDDGDDRF